MPVALITGASRGFGLAAARALASQDWTVIADGRQAGDLATALHGLGDVVAIPGDVTDAGHRAELAALVSRLGRLDVLVSNASTLGSSPLPPLRRYDIGELRRVFETNVIAPLALYQLVAAELDAAGGVVVNVSSDAGVEAYPGWGGYGSSKAALDQVTAVLAAEETGVRWYALDPGDMRTRMHQRAYPGEDISDRPEPEAVVPALLRLLAERPPSGRYRSVDLLAPAVTS
jgi:NAD(P)-dependent dehydrogenase (short-subunit alcohol dehydrogenase family)